jgi:nucleotide-binding universal stress UspA family protein
MAAIQRILSAVDFSETSTAAARRALELARATGAELVFLHALHEPAFSYADGAGYLTPDLIEQFELEMQRRLDAWAQSLAEPGLRMRTRVVHGAPQTALVDAAKDERADLIVLGTHGRTGLGHLLLGSVAERVVRTSPVPVLTVRTK